MMLDDARLQLHWAAQLAATPGRTLAPPREDDSHTSFRWIGDALRQEDDFRCWPHHFDIATLLEFAGGRSIGAGLSPGDESCDGPYWYVNHYPATPRRDLPPLAGGGTWNTSGWVGAILPLSRGGDVQAFLDSAIAASRTLIA